MNKSVLMLCAFAMVGCTGKGDSPYGEKGKVFCNERYLLPNSGPLDAKALKIATHGYMYAMAAALTLQKDNKESGEHHFERPDRLRLVNSHNPWGECFSADTYILKPEKTSEGNEIVIAFRGSDDACDWFMTNLNWFSSKKQYYQAVNYTARMIKEYYTDKEKVTVAGISLGGAIAVYVAKNYLTRKYVDEVWAINPSPRTYSDGFPDKRIWLAATYNEALIKTRDKKYSFINGWGGIVGPSEQMTTQYDLVESNSVYGHFRWVIVREMLFAADYKLTDYGTQNIRTEPFDILKQSSFKSCQK
ncbi:hypothetical protein A3N68_14195 [Enterobacter asburiae]|uniref:Mbeg1-like protein n=1 Tax=Enterobacter asburiae TaxID=61645 RepID=UPI0007B3C67D|nr:Mbeg1-like protein [Enterobacter asburiae]KZR46917.1 hypothetical protein A3N68_14195 [Enterobacter asburiae]